MGKSCFVCGNDWCFNLIEDPLNLEDNVCDNCRNLPADQKCSACLNQKSVAKKNLFQILFAILILLLISIILVPIVGNIKNIIRL